MFWRRKPKKWGGVPATTDEAFACLPVGYEWCCISSLGGRGEWYASVKSEDGWTYCNFVPCRCFETPLAAMQDAAAESWKKYERMDTPKEPPHA